MKNGENHVDQWDIHEGYSSFPTTWTGKTIFYKTNDSKETKKPMSEKFLQASKRAVKEVFYSSTTMNVWRPLINQR